MDTTTVVDQQIIDGQKLAEQFAFDGFEVAGAFWVKFAQSEGDPWSFYIVSKTIDELGLQAAYRAIHASLKKIPAASGLWSSLFQIRLVGVKDRIAQELLSIQKQYPARLPTLIRGARLGDTEIEKVYICPKPKAIRNSQIDANVKRFLDEGWELDGGWGDGYPCVRKGSDQVGFMYRIRVDEQMTPDKVPYLEGERPLPSP